MPRIRKENARYHVISLRLTEEESNHLETIMAKTHSSVSHFMRDALNYFVTYHERLRVE